MTLRPSCGDPSLFKLLFQHLAADPAAESRHRQCAGDDDHEEPGGCGGVHGVDVGLFRAIVQHGAGPAVRVKKEYHSLCQWRLYKCRCKHGDDEKH